MATFPLTSHWLLLVVYCDSLTYPSTNRTGKARKMCVGAFIGNPRENSEWRRNLWTDGKRLPTAESSSFIDVFKRKFAIYPPISIRKIFWSENLGGLSSWIGLKSLKENNGNFQKRINFQKIVPNKGVGTKCRAWRWRHKRAHDPH